MRLIGPLLTYCTLTLVIAFVLVACESPQQSSPPPTTPPPSSSPSSSTPPSQPSAPSEPSEPSEPSNSPPQSQQTGESSPPGSEQQQASPEQARQQAAQTLKKAGEQVSETAQQLPAPTGGEWDPLIPDSENPNQTDSETYEDSAALPPSSQQASRPESTEADDMAIENGAQAQDDRLMEDGSPAQGDGDTSTENGPNAQAGGEQSETGGDSADSESANGDSAGSEYPGDIAKDIQAAHEALEKAGIAIQAAGVALETAETEAELAEAEKALARARVSVIFAGQDLMDISDIFEGTPQEDAILEAEKALNEANVAIVIATDAIFDSRIQLPEFDQMKRQGEAVSGAESGQQDGQAAGGEQAAYPRGAGGIGGSELDKALDDSIAIFEGTILDARNEVLGSTPPPTSAENVPGVAVLGGKGLEQGSGTFEENENERLEPGIPDVIENGRMPEGSEVAKTEGATPPVPEDIPSPQGDDIVAQQLREAAAAETDPDLRAKLWDEYKKYKAGL